MTKDVASWVPAFEAHLAASTLKPIEYQLVDMDGDTVGWDKVIQGIQVLESGKAAKKIVVQVQVAE